MLKNITLSADAEIIAKARLKARMEHTTLNVQFRQWLEQYVYFVYFGDVFWGRPFVYFL